MDAKLLYTVRFENGQTMDVVAEGEIDARVKAYALLVAAGIKRQLLIHTVELKGGYDAA